MENTIEREFTGIIPFVSRLFCRNIDFWKPSHSVCPNLIQNKHWFIAEQFFYVRFCCPENINHNTSEHYFAKQTALRLNQCYWRYSNSLVFASPQQFWSPFINQKTEWELWKNVKSPKYLVVAGQALNSSGYFKIFWDHLKNYFQWRCNISALITESVISAIALNDRDVSCLTNASYAASLNFTSVPTTVLMLSAYFKRNLTSTSWHAVCPNLAQALPKNRISLRT